MDITAINNQFGLHGTVEFMKGQGGLPVAVVTSPHADAVISLYGAQVLRYKPKGKEEALWMSAKSYFEEGKPIRGGIPVCFPWFGPHARDTEKPQHGFARLLTWDVSGTSVLQDGTVEVRLSLRDSPKTHALWPHSFTAEFIAKIGPSLDVELACTNTGAEAFTYTDALHTYLAVSDIGNVTLRGLGGCMFFEGMGTTPIRQEETILEIAQETNRRYLETDAECIIEDRGVPRTIGVAKKGSRVTVVWNPWDATAKTIADMDDDGYRTMLCVEAVNTYTDAVVLEPGKRFTLGTSISVD